MCFIYANIKFVFLGDPKVLFVSQILLKSLFILTSAGLHSQEAAGRTSPWPQGNP